MELLIFMDNLKESNPGIWVSIMAFLLGIVIATILTLAAVYVIAGCFEKTKKHEGAVSLIGEEVIYQFNDMELLREQQGIMGGYLHILEVRAIIEGIEL